jgi:single-stranded-DNA-specific exonuclease
MLAGVGVTYFLIQKIAEKLEIEVSDNYLLWTAIGSIADRVPLVDVNRSIVKRSLELWNSYDDETLETFKQIFWKGDDVFSRLALIRQIIKIFNGGRLADGDHKSLQALISLPHEKERIINELMEIQSQHDENLNTAITKLSKLIPETVITYWIFYDKDDILPYNTLGYCASVLANEKMIPIVLLKRRNGDVVCEARCTDGFNLVDAFRYCKHHLLQFGGHKRAAGFVTKEEMIEGFEKAFEKYVHFHEREIIRQKEMKIDAVIDFDTLEDKMMLRQIDFSPFLPFGEGNPEPILLLKNFLWERDSDSIPMRSDNPKLMNGEKYDIAVSYTGNFAMVRDFVKSGDTNEN